MTTGWPKRSLLKRTGSAVAALALVTGAGAASAIFVDHLADRAKLRAYAAATRMPAEPAQFQEKTAVAMPVTTASVPARPGPENTPAASSVALAAKAAAAAGSLPASAGIPHKASAAADTVAPTEATVTLASEPAIEAEGNIEPVLTAGESDLSDKTLTGSIAGPRFEYDAAEPSLPGDGEVDATETTEKSAGRTAKVLKYVNLRSGPADESKVLTVVPASAKVNVLSCKSWCEVEYAGTKGFIYKRFIGT